MIQHSVEIKCEKMVHEMMAILVSIRNAIKGTNEKYEPLQEEGGDEKKEAEEQSDDDDDDDDDHEVVVDVADSNEQQKSQVTKILEQLNDLGRQVRQSPFKMLTALVNLTMVVDGIEATRLGTSAWYYLAIDTLGFLAAVAASSDFVRQVTREKEYQEGLARENQRNAKKIAKFKADARLKAAVETPLLEVDPEEVEGACVEAEENGILESRIVEARLRAEQVRWGDAQTLVCGSVGCPCALCVRRQDACSDWRQSARKSAIVTTRLSSPSRAAVYSPAYPPVAQAIEAQRLFREAEEAKRIRKERALAVLAELSAPEPLDVDIPALQAAIDEADAAGLGPADEQLARMKMMAATSAQATRAMAQKRLLAAAHVLNLEEEGEGPSKHEMLSIDVAVLHQALADAELAHVDTAVIKRAMGIEHDAMDKQTSHAMRVAMAVGKFVKRGHDLHERNEALKLLHEAVEQCAPCGSNPSVVTVVTVGLSGSGR